MDPMSRVTMAVMIASSSIGAFAAGAAAQTFVPVTEAMLASPNPADWLMMNRTLDEQRFSPLNQINTRNVGQLRMAWSRGLPNGTQESTPIVSYAVNGKQYVMVFTGEGQSVTAGPLGLTKNSMAPAVRGHNSIFAFALP